MRGPLVRFATAVRVGWSSSIAFASVGTALTTLVILPVLDIAFDIVMGTDLSSPDLVATGYAAALVALGVSIAGGVVGAVASDRMLGIFAEVHARRRVDPVYWLSVAFMPTLLGLVTALIGLGAVLALSGGAGLPLFFVACAAVPAVIACGFLMGVFAAGIGVGLPDPYLGATVLGVFLPALCGVIVPLASTPAWFQAVAAAVPMSRLIQALQAGAPIAPAAALDLAVAGIWAAVGLVAVRVAVARFRAGQRAVMP